MSFNGSGTFNINTAGQPVVTGTVISSSVFNALTADLATGLSTCITKDGQTTVTANIPMNSFKFTGLAAGTAATDSVRLGQLQAGAATLITVTGTNTYAGTMTPALSAYAAGNTFSFLVPNTNTTSCTLNIDGLGAKSITRDGTTALVAGDLVANSEVVVVYDGTQFQVLNSNSKTNFNLSGTLTVAGNTTLSGGTANGVAYLNGSKVLTTGSALQFSGTYLQTLNGTGIQMQNAGATANWFFETSGLNLSFTSAQNGAAIWSINGSEQMRLNSTGLGIGTSSFSARLAVSAAKATVQVTSTTGTNGAYQAFTNTGGNFYTGLDSSTGGDFAAAYAGVMWHGGAYPLLFGTSNTERMRIASAGNVTINAPSSGLPLAVSRADTGAVAVLSGPNSTSGIKLGLNVVAGEVGSIKWDNSATLTGTVNGVGINANGGGIAFQNNDVTAAYLNTSGNLGLGVTPSAWASYKALSLGNIGSSIAGQTAANGTVFTSNAYYNAGWKYAATAAACYFDAGNNVGGGFTWNQAASGTAGNAITFTQAMTLNASGYLGIGTTNPLQPLVVSNGGAAGFEFVPASGIMQTYNRSGAAYTDMRFDATQLLFYTGSSPAERARIDSSGNLLVGTTSAGGNNTTGQAWIYNSGSSYGSLGHITGTGSGTGYLQFLYNGTVIGSVTQNGTTGVLYNITSDYRLKEFVAPVTNSGERIDALNPVEFDWKSDGSRARGFFAHEFQQVYANSVTGEKDGVDTDGNPVYQTMQASTAEVIADLVAEIKSLRQRVAQLEVK